MQNISKIKPPSTRGVSSIQKRWAILKTDEATETYEAIEDLTYMIRVTRSSEIYPSRTHDICHDMMRIISRLRSRRKNHHTREKVMVIIHKYLGAVRIFLMTTQIEGVILYQKLFESTMIAILREVENIEGSI